MRNEPWVQNHELPPSRVTEYAANAFADIRRMYHIQTVAYKAALGMLDWSDSDATHVQTRLPDLRLVGAADAAGKSAAWFFFSVGIGKAPPGTGVSSVKPGYGRAAGVT